MHFSSRTQWDLAESSYAREVREARASGDRLYDLTISNPTHCGFEYNVGEVLEPLLNREAMLYTPDPLGMLSAREAVAAYYADHQAAVDPSHIVLTSSTSESYSFLFRLLCDPGDEVLVPQPSYPLFDFLAGLDDVQLRGYSLFYDHGWWIDFAQLERSISPRTRAILVVHPNNPTGHWTSHVERQLLQELCARHNLALIVDEVFLDYPLRESPAAAGSFAVAPHPALTFVLSGLSKIAALPQMKAAWILAFGPPQLRTEALGRLEVIADTFLSVSAPIQLALPQWLAGRHPIEQQILKRVRTNLATLHRLTDALPGRIHVLEIDAGWCAILALPGCVGEAECAERLVRERRVIVHPGSFYSIAEPNRVVVSLIGLTDELEAGVPIAIS